MKKTSLVVDDFPLFRLPYSPSFTPQPLITSPPRLVFVCMSCANENEEWEDENVEVKVTLPEQRARKEEIKISVIIVNMRKVVDGG